jgi:hypothetical protein
VLLQQLVGLVARHQRALSAIAGVLAAPCGDAPPRP